jgi:hypothetical protein
MQWHICVCVCVAIYGEKSEGFVLRVYSSDDRHFTDFIVTIFVTAVEKADFSSVIS